jgi:cytochrome P450
MKACIDETMRFAGPLRHVGRVAGSEMCLSNVRIPPGSAIYVKLE